MAVFGKKGKPVSGKESIPPYTSVKSTPNRGKKDCAEGDKVQEPRTGKKIGIRQLFFKKEKKKGIPFTVKGKYERWRGNTARRRGLTPLSLREHSVGKRNSVFVVEELEKGSW